LIGSKKIVNQWRKTTVLERVKNRIPKENSGGDKATDAITNYFNMFITVFTNVRF